MAKKPHIKVTKRDLTKSAVLAAIGGSSVGGGVAGATSPENPSKSTHVPRSTLYAQLTPTVKSESTLPPAGKRLAEELHSENVATRAGYAPIKTGVAHPSTGFKLIKSGNEYYRVSAVRGGDEVVKRYTLAVEEVATTNGLQKLEDLPAGQAAALNTALTVRERETSVRDSQSGYTRITLTPPVAEQMPFVGEGTSKAVKFQANGRAFRSNVRQERVREPVREYSISKYAESRQQAQRKLKERARTAVSRADLGAESATIDSAIGSKEYLRDPAEGYRQLLQEVSDGNASVYSTVLGPIIYDGEYYEFVHKTIQS